MRLKLLHIIAGMDPKLGGVSQALRTMIKGVSKLEVYNEVVCLDEPNSSFLQTSPFPIAALGPGKGPWNYSSKTIPWLVKNLVRFDAVIIHGLWLYHGYALRKALKNLRQDSKRNKLRINFPRIYVMPHGMLDPYFQNSPGRKLKALRNWIFWKVIESNVVNEADGVLFTCKEELRLARLPFQPYHPKKESVIGLGVEEPPSFSPYLNEALRDKCPQLNDSPYLLFLSRVNEKKGVDLLIKAYQSVSETKRKAGDAMPKLVIAGPGVETAYGQRMMRLAHGSLEFKSSILFPGMLTGDAKWGAIYGCEAFVLPSHQENFGIAVVEALACKKPVLISNQINIWKEIITNDGGIVKDDTLEGTIELLKCWTQLSGENKLTMAQNARNSFEKNFSVIPAAIRFFKAINNN